MNTTTSPQDPDARTYCDHCTTSTSPDADGQPTPCPTTDYACTDCCPCCGTGLFFEFGGRVFPAVATGKPWNGWVTPIVTRAVAEAIAHFMDEEGALCTMTFDGDTAVVRDLNGTQADDILTPTSSGHYDLGSLGFTFSRDNGPADYDRADK